MNFVVMTMAQGGAVADLCARLAASQDTRPVAVLLDCATTQAPRLERVRKRFRQLARRGWRGVQLARAEADIQRRLEAKFGRIEDVSRKLEVPLHRLPEGVNSDTCRRLLRELRADVILGFGNRIVDGATLDAATQGGLNIHAGKVPEFRGSGPPGFWEILAHETTASLTIHRMLPALDAGPILREHIVDIPRCPTLLEAVCEVEWQLYLAGPAVYAQTVADLVRGQTTETPQRPWGRRPYQKPSWADWQSAIAQYERWKGSGRS